MRNENKKIHRPDSKFQEFLSVVNGTCGMAIPSYKDLFRNFELAEVAAAGRISDVASANAITATEAAVLVFVVQGPDVFKEYIISKAGSAEAAAVVNAYEQFRCDREIFLRTVKGLALGKNLIDLQERLVVVELDPEGEFIFRVLAYENFQGFDFRRFKTCPVCSNIFWAERIDKEACSPECSLTLRQRNFQKKNKSLINREKRRGYYIKKRIKFCSACVHPFNKFGCTPVACNQQKEEA